MRSLSNFLFKLQHALADRVLEPANSEIDHCRSVASVDVEHKRVDGSVIGGNAHFVSLEADC